jgi:type I restriction enzyme S subunit
MSLTGTTGKDDYGNVAVLGDEHENYLLNQRVACIKPLSTRVLKDFLATFLGNEKVKGEIISRSRGVRQANISNSDILELQLPLPPVQIQREFAERLRTVEQQLTLQLTSSGQLDALFASLQHRAFRGVSVRI